MDGAKGISRRTVLAAAAASAPVSGAAVAREAPAVTDFSEAEIGRIFERYAAFGDKDSGGAGDNACGDWLISELSAAGYACQRQVFEAPAFDLEVAELSTEGARASVIPQAVVTPTPDGGARGRLYAAGAGPKAGEIALLVLPHRRWSTAVGLVERLVKAEISAGAAAVVVVTTGPTGEALALNAPADKPLFTRPVVMLAPKDAGPFIAAAAAGREANLRVAGRALRRPAFNVVGRLNSGRPRSLVLSTPRSGWFGCAGERGPGLAAWLLLAKWAARAPLNAEVELICTSGHEYENLGGERYIHELAPKPERTALWVHLGANVAARDWHEGGAALSPLPSADPQRWLLASAALRDRVAAAFAGQPGLEQVYPATPETAAGELINILRAGYAPAMGVFGGHRFHHARGDDLRCVAPGPTRAAAEAFATVIAGQLAS